MAAQVMESWRREGFGNPAGSQKSGAVYKCHQPGRGVWLTVGPDFWFFPS